MDPESKTKMKKTKLTKLTALIICRDLWTWLAENPNCADKGAWPGWRKVPAKYGAMSHDCPCCEFAGTKDLRNGCQNCPLDGYAWKSLYPCGREDGFGCERDPTSSFNLWYYSSSFDSACRAAAARKMADACVRALADLRKESARKRAALTTRRSR